MTRTSSKSAGIRKIPSVASPLRAMIWLIVKMVKMMMVAMLEVEKRRYLVGESGEDPGQLSAGEPILLDLKDLLQSFLLYITAPKKSTRMIIAKLG